MNPNIDIKAIITKFGPPGYENANKKLSKLNEVFWAEFYAQNRTKLIFEPDEEEFYDFDSKNFVQKTPDAIRTQLAALVLEGARAWPAYNTLEQFRNEKILAGVLRHLR